MINLVLITGFLGTGKTTFLKSLIEEYKDSRIGVIVNEFGEINIDSKLIKKDELKIMELSNGSIFCACIKENFIAGLIELSRIDLDFLFIEASGLADPSNMSSILNTIRYKVFNNYDYRGSICIIDAKNFLKLYELLPSLHNQIEYSSTILVNKSDLVESKIITDILIRLSKINPTAAILITSFCKVDIKQIIENLNNVIVQAKESTNTFENRPKTFILKGESIISYDSLSKFLEEVSKSVYRIKGFAKTNQGNVLISVVGEHVNITKWDYSIDETQIILISSIGIRMISILLNKIETYLKDKIYIA